MKKEMQRRDLLVRGAATLVDAGWLPHTAVQAAGEPWPIKPIRIVVPYNAGGATDILARTFAEGLAKRLGQPVIVDNRLGGSGIVGTNYVAKAEPDGHTLLVSFSSSMLAYQFLYTKLPYNPQKDIALVTQISAAPLLLALHPSVPASNMKEFLAYAKANKGKLSYGSYGVGSYAHLAGAYISKVTGAEMTHVAYKGESQMVQELIGGQFQFGFASAQNVKPFVDAGRIKAIAVSGRQHMEVMPHVPTIYEQGFHDDAYSLVGWIAMGAPAGVPPEIIERLYAHLAEIAKEPKTQERIMGTGFTAMMTSPKQFRGNYQREMPVWKALVEDTGARLD